MSGISEADFSRLEEIAKDAANNISTDKMEAVCEKVIVKSFRSLGLDADNYIETQKDFGYLRKTRNRAEDVGKVVFTKIAQLSVIGVIACISAALGSLFTFKQ